MENHKNRPLISVVIPTYNRGWIIAEAIESVLAQDFKNFQLIVVDDGSTDNTREIIRFYERDIILISQDRQGVSAARNSGIAAAAGRFIAFLDSDDIWQPEKLSVQVEFFNNHPEAFICQTEEIWIKNGLRINPKKRHKKPSGMIFEPSLSLCLVSPSAVMMRQSLFEIVGLFDERLPACEDYDLWLRVGCRHPVFLIDTPLVVKRGGHADQLSAEPGLDKYRIQSLKKILESALLTRTQREAAAKILREKCAIYSLGCKKRDRFEEAAFYRRLASRYASEKCLA